MDENQGQTHRQMHNLAVRVVHDAIEKAMARVSTGKLPGNDKSCIQSIETTRRVSLSALFVLTSEVATSAITNAINQLRSAAGFNPGSQTTTVITTEDEHELSTNSNGSLEDACQNEPVSHEANQEPNTLDDAALSSIRAETAEIFISEILAAGCHQHLASRKQQETPLTSSQAVQPDFNKATELERPMKLKYEHETAELFVSDLVSATINHLATRIRPHDDPIPEEAVLSDRRPPASRSQERRNFSDKSPEEEVVVVPAEEAAEPIGMVKYEHDAAEFFITDLFTTTINRLSTMREKHQAREKLLSREKLRSARSRERHKSSEIAATEIVVAVVPPKTPQPPLGSVKAPRVPSRKNHHRLGPPRSAQSSTQEEANSSKRPPPSDNKPQLATLNPVDRVRRTYRPKRPVHTPKTDLLPSLPLSRLPSPNDHNHVDAEIGYVSTPETVDVGHRSHLDPLRPSPALPVPRPKVPLVMADRPDRLGLLKKPARRTGYCQQCIYEGRSCKISECLKHQLLR